MNAKKIVAALLAVVLLIGIGVGGTLAWLKDQTETVTNTFAIGDIEIDLKETVNGTVTSAKDNDVTNNSFKIVPGANQTKDPVVSVTADSENCYVFVEITETNVKVDDVTYITWEIANGWTLVPGETNVYYREHTMGTETSASVLKDNKVSYSDKLTKAQLEALDALAEDPSIEFKAYAIQKDNLTETNIFKIWEMAKAAA